MEPGDLFSEKKSNASFDPALMRKMDFDSDSATLPALNLVDIWSLRSEKYPICWVMLIVEPWRNDHLDFSVSVFLRKSNHAVTW